MTPSSVTIPVISSAGVTSKAGFRTSVPAGAMRRPRIGRDLVRLSLLDRDGRAVRGLEVDRARRRGDVERDAVTRRQDGQRVRADLVGRVAVGGHSIGPDDHHVHLATRHQVAGRDVRDERVRHAGLGQLPGGQSCALQVRPCLVDPDVERATGVVGDLDDPEGRPELPAGERPGVAVGEDPQRTVGRHGQGREAELRQPSVVGGRLQDDRVGLGPEGVGDRPAVVGQVAHRFVAGHHPVDRPAQVDRGRARLDERIGAAAERGPAGVRSAVPDALGRERQPDGRDLPDRRGAAHDHLADRIGDLTGRAVLDLDQGVGELPLVDQDQRAAVHPERGAEAGRGRRARVGDADHRRAGVRVKDPGRGLGRRALECLRGTCDRRRGLDQLTGELPEEPATSEVDRCRPIRR